MSRRERGRPRIGEATSSVPSLPGTEMVETPNYSNIIYCCEVHIHCACKLTKIKPCLPVCSDQSTIQNVFGFLQDYVPQVS